MVLLLLGLGAGSKWVGVSASSGEASSVGVSWGWVLSGVVEGLIDDPPAANLFARRLFVIFRSSFLLRPPYQIILRN